MYGLITKDLLAPILVNKGAVSLKRSDASLVFMCLITLFTMQPCVEVRAQSEFVHNNPQPPCPPGMAQPQNCTDVLRMAYTLAIQKKGYANANGDSIPDTMERNYHIDSNDCTTGNAQVECMFNDECTAQFGRMWMLRSNSANHSTSLFKAADGTEFECDFTPGGSVKRGVGRSGKLLKRADVKIGPPMPDRGEVVDPAYNCDLNGARFSPYGNGGGFSASNMAMLMALFQQLQQMKQQRANSTGSTTESEIGKVPEESVVIVVPTPSPTATNTPVPGDLVSSDNVLIEAIDDYDSLLATETPAEEFLESEEIGG